MNVKFLTSKTRVTPLGSMSIPRLELLSAVLLSKSMDSVNLSLESELSLLEPVSYTDSKAALYLIRGVNQERKQFVDRPL